MDEISRESDAGLLARAATGDERAFRVLCERHGSLCASRAYDVLRNRTLAEDAVQEAFVDLWRTAASFDAARASVRTWLCVLVHRRSVDAVRREARRRRADDIECTTNVEPASYTAEELLVLRIERRNVQAALKRIPCKKRELLELAYYGGLTQSQLAARLGVPLGTIKSRMGQALADLGAALAAASPITD